ncbi:hypothetical protein [Comamonas koreensis]|uniref:Uncharacterized protein n=1 Tax=Comamonas koreensis TaxID=160825 RepID=A0AAW4XWX7_9BURK|nr:hypothetical protein [Comamonas koreensis]MCD2165553.1 hypothetical protein [Comamonas koreensis]
MNASNFGAARWRLAAITFAAIACATLLTAGSKFSQTPPLAREQGQSSSTARTSEPSTTSSGNSALQTQQGKSIVSKSRDVKARRISDQPDDTASLRYIEASSVRRLLGVDTEQHLNLLLDDGNVEWSVLDENYRAIALQRTNGDSGMFHLAGAEGSNYMLRFHNRSENSYQVIATVDGLDVIGGKPISQMSSGGYMLGPQQWLTIRGFRKSNKEEASFLFSTQGHAYAANNEAGDIMAIGVISVTLFKVQDVHGTRAAKRISRTHTPYVCGMVVDTKRLS